MPFYKLARFAFGVIILVRFATGASAHPMLADAADNQSWHADESTGDAVYIGDDHSTPTLVIKKSVVVGHRLGVTVTTDGKACVVRSGLAKLTLDLSKDKATALTLDGASAPPMLSIDGKESAASKAKWAQLCADGTSTIALEFTGATYAMVKLNANVGDAAPSKSAAAEATAAATTKPAMPGSGNIAHTSAHGVPARVPFVAFPANVKAAQMVQAAIAFRSNGLKVCPICGGKGQLVTHTKTGEYRSGNSIMSNYRDSTDACPTCKGTGRVQASQEALNRLSDKMLTALAGTDPNEKGYADRLKAVTNILMESVAVDHDGQMMLTKAALNELQPEGAKPGRSFIIAGHLTFIEPLETPRGKLYAIQPDNGGNKTILLSNPRIADAKEGDAVVGGGIFVGIAGADSDQMPVLQEGFALHNASH